MPPKVYESPGVFRQALESRINARVSSSAELQRLRRLVAFDRLLARLFMNQDSPWIVKGGYGFEVRYGMNARTTKDIDLALPEIISDATTAEGTIQQLWEELQETTAHDVGDHFVIRIGAPQQEFDAPPGGGARFPVEVLLDRRTFALDKDAPAPDSLKPAIRATFDHRRTHDIPVTIPAAPPMWASSFTSMAKQVNLSETTIEAAVTRMNDYWKKIF